MPCNAMALTSSYTGELRPNEENYEDIYPLLPSDDAFHGPLHRDLVKLDLHPEIYISKNMFSYLSTILVKRGVTVNVLSKSKDILQSSIDFHRVRDSEDWYGDWADNFFLNFYGLFSNCTVKRNACYFDQP